MVVSYYIHFQKAGINTSSTLTSHIVLLEKYQLGPEAHDHIANLPQAYHCSHVAWKECSCVESWHFYLASFTKFYLLSLLLLLDSIFSVF